MAAFMLPSMSSFSYLMPALELKPSQIWTSALTGREGGQAHPRPVVPIGAVFGLGRKGDDTLCINFSPF